MGAAEGSRQRTLTLATLRAFYQGVGAGIGVIQAAGNPSTAADETQGYRPGSLWYVTGTGTLFVCTDAAEGAAVWAELSTGGGGGDLGDLDDVDLATLAPGYTASANNTTAARDLLWYDGSNWVGGRPRRGKFRFTTTAYTLQPEDHDVFIYSQGGNIDFALADFPTGYSFGLYVTSGGSITVGRTGSGSISFVSNFPGIGGATSITIPAGTYAWFSRTAGDVIFVNVVRRPTQSFVIACSDETTDLTTGTAKVTFRMPYAFTLSAVRASVTEAPTGSVLTVDINEAGTSILSTKLTTAATEKTSTTAATAAVISDTALADDAEITIDIDGVGSTDPGKGLKVTLIGVQA